MLCKGAIFDMDGILFDTERLYQETWKELADERGIDLGTDYTKTITGTSGEHMRQIVSRFYQVEDSSIIIEECLKRMRKKLSVCVPLKAGVQEILEFFRERDVRIAVASSSFREEIEGNLKKSGLESYFEKVISGTELEHGKPAPDIFLYAANALGLKPEECYVFEDSSNGVRAGHAAGCVTIMIPDLIEPTSEITALCSKVCSDFYQVRKIIENE